jgi:DNA-binding response OmpR family regulator
MWNGLTQEEQLALSELQILQARLGERDTSNQKSDAGAGELDKAFRSLARQQHHALTRLAAKGLCRQTKTGWRIVGDLLTMYIVNVEGRGRGKIWLDEKADILHQGQTPLKELTPLERSVLRFFVKHPRVGHPKTDLIMSVWPEDARRDIGVSDDSLYQVISSLRTKIEPNRAKPCYIATWRGEAENGYQFFPEGRPE